MRLMSPHKMKKQKMKSMVTSQSQQTIGPASYVLGPINSPKVHSRSPGRAISPAEVANHIKYSQIMPKLKSQIVGVHYKTNPSNSMIYSGGQKSSSLKRSCNMDAKVSFNDTSRSQGNFRHIMNQPSLVYNKPDAGLRSRSSGTEKDS